MSRQAIRKKQSYLQMRQSLQITNLTAADLKTVKRITDKVLTPPRPGIAMLCSCCSC